MKTRKNLAQTELDFDGGQARAHEVTQQLTKLAARLQTPGQSLYMWTVSDAPPILRKVAGEVALAAPDSLFRGVSHIGFQRDGAADLDVAVLIGSAWGATHALVIANGFRVDGGRFVFYYPIPLGVFEFRKRIASLSMCGSLAA